MDEEGGEERWMGAFMVLPLEILQHFMSYLRIREICWALPSLNKQWHALLVFLNMSFSTNNHILAGRPRAVGTFAQLHEHRNGEL